MMVVTLTVSEMSMECVLGHYSWSNWNASCSWRRQVYLHWHHVIGKTQRCLVIFSKLTCMSTPGSSVGVWSIWEKCWAFWRLYWVDVDHLIHVLVGLLETVEKAITLAAICLFFFVVVPKYNRCVSWLTSVWIDKNALRLKVLYT